MKRGAPISLYLTSYTSWLKWKGCSEATINGYVKRIKRFIADIGDLKADRIRKKDIVNWTIILSQRVSKDYVITCLWAIRSFLKFLNEEIKIRTYNFGHFKIPKRTKKERVEALKNEEVKKLLSCLDTNNIHDLRLRALIELILNTGLRPSEALSLSRKDVENLPDSIVIIGKGNKPRKIFLNERVKYWLKKYLEARKDNHPALFVTHCRSNRWSLRRAEEAFHNLVKKVINDTSRKITLHTLRHTFGTNLLRHGCPVDYIAKLMGHSNLETTRIYYLAVLEEDAERAYRTYLNYDD